MKKSEIYRLLQKMMIGYIPKEQTFDETIGILRELFIQEDLAKFAEEQEEKQE